jgi:hypothetical protein
MFRLFNRPATKVRRRRPAIATRPTCDALEGRQLLSVSSAVSPPATPAPLLVAVQTPPQLRPPVPVHPVAEARLFPPEPV